MTGFGPYLSAMIPKGIVARKSAVRSVSSVLVGRCTSLTAAEVQQLIGCEQPGYLLLNVRNLAIRLMHKTSRPDLGNIVLLVILSTDSEFDKSQGWSTLSVEGKI
jgi:hypothetical protein